MSDVYFFIGRLTYLILYFDPIIEAPLFDETPAYMAYMEPVMRFFLE